MRFEFRAVGASQNVSVVNTVLGAIVADQFKAMADRVEGGEAATAVAQDLLKRHMKVVFNGNGYAEEWPAEAEAKGLFVIPSNVDAMCCLSAPKNVEMFEGIKVAARLATARPTAAAPPAFVW
jgi:glutamine synthetase